MQQSTTSDAVESNRIKLHKSRSVPAVNELPEENHGKAIESRLCQVLAAEETYDSPAIFDLDQAARRRGRITMIDWTHDSCRVPWF